MTTRRRGFGALTLLMLAGCASGETGAVDSGLSAFVEDSLISGHVLENTTACEVDADCFLRIEFADTSVVALYGFGERPAPGCSIPTAVSDAAFDLAPDDAIDVVLASCGSEGLFLRRLERRVELRSGPAPGAGSPAVSGVACDDPTVDPVVTELRVGLEQGVLARFAAERFGASVGCDGQAAAEFDGRPFGGVRLTYPGGAILSLETMPPETSIVTLTHPVGFDDEEELIAALHDHASDIGLRIDWATPERVTDGDGSISTFWDPDSGLNASASLVRSGEFLRSVRISMAL